MGWCLNIILLEHRAGFRRTRKIIWIKHVWEIHRLNPITRQVQQIKHSTGKGLQRPAILLLCSFLVSFHMLCASCLSVCFNSSTVWIWRVHTHTRTHKHHNTSHSYSCPGPTGRGNIPHIFWGEGEGGDSRAEEGLTSVNGSLLYLACSITCSVCLIIWIQIVSLPRTF